MTPPSLFKLEKQPVTCKTNDWLVLVLKLKHTF